MSDSVKVGDRVYISLELIQQIYEQKEHRTEVVVLVDVTEMEDGIKILRFAKP